MHKPIQIKNLSLTFPHKICFENFNTQINYGDRIAIIGRNGCGKTSLLKMLYDVDRKDNVIKYVDDITIGYVPQIINDFDNLSGSQRLNKALTNALNIKPDILLLDEPTNHLDESNRKSLMRMLQSYSGTLIIVTHDIELLTCCVEIVWHIDDCKINKFLGTYDDYICKVKAKRISITNELVKFDHQKKDMHHKLMQEQKRAAKSKSKGIRSVDKQKWPTMISNNKAMQAQETSGRKKSNIDQKKRAPIDQLSSLQLPEIILPKFSFNHAFNTNKSTIISISNASVGYTANESVLNKINLSMTAKERIAIKGNNASGKSTLIKAILGEITISSCLVIGIP